MRDTKGDVDFTLLDLAALATYSRSGGGAWVVSDLHPRRGQKDYHQHVTVDSMDDTHEHKRPEEDVRELESIPPKHTHTYSPSHPSCSSCVVKRGSWVGKLETTTGKNLSRHTSCRVAALLKTRRRHWWKEEESMEDHAFVEETEDVRQALGSWIPGGRPTELQL